MGFEVEIAIKSVPTGSSPGMDGITDMMLLKLWKDLRTREIDAQVKPKRNL